MNDSPVYQIFRTVLSASQYDGSTGRVYQFADLLFGVSLVLIGGRRYRHEYLTGLGYSLEAVPTTLSTLYTLFQTDVSPYTILRGQIVSEANAEAHRSMTIADSICTYAKNDLLNSDKIAPPGCTVVEFDVSSGLCSLGIGGKTMLFSSLRAEIRYSKEP